MRRRVETLEALPDWTVDVRLVDAKTGAVVRDWWSPVRGEIVYVPRDSLVAVRQRVDEPVPRYVGWQPLTRSGSFRPP